ncbi:hypothetical protein GQ42DRAFT_161963, partial [Ramicandelaber brevisporus]
MRRCACAFGCCCLACSLSPSLPLTFVFHCIRFCFKILSSIACSLLSLVSLFLCVFVSIRVFPAACSICFPSLLVRPSSVGFLPHLLLVVIGRRCRQV